MTRGYADPSSLEPGELLRLRVSTGAPAFHVTVYRLAAALERVGTWGPLVGCARPDGAVAAAWDWPGYEIEIPSGWPSGVYVAVFGDCRGNGHVECVPEAPPPLDAREGRALFVVRRAAGRRPAPLLYKVSLFTYHAYNATGGGSLYVNPSVDGQSGRSRVTLLRPGGGTGGALSFPDAVDVYDPATPREGVAHWDGPFIGWLAETHHEVDYCTDLDLHRCPALLEGHRALLSVGHDEYWSEPMRVAVEAFAADGGHVAFFSGNTCFWRVELEPGEVMSCAHPPVASGECDQWWRLRPEAALTGVSYRHGGGWWSGPREPLGYTVNHANHWVFEGTGLRESDTFAADARLVGYECDGTPLDPSWPRPRAAAITGTPADFVVLGFAPLGPGWQDRPDGSAAVATMGMHVPGGVVFTAATTDWARVLAAGDPAVDRITRNVLDRLCLSSAPIRAPDAARAGTDVTVWVDAPVGADVEWAASDGVVRGDGAKASVTLPEEAGLLTVTATVLRDGAADAFGTRTLEVLGARAEAQLRLLDAARRLLASVPPAPAPAAPAQRGNRQLHDPRWEPLRDGLRRPLEAAEAREVAALAGAVVEAAQRLARVAADAGGDEEAADGV